MAGGPLSGIRVLDFSRLYPGPLAAMLMGDLGAKVIKIEDKNFPDTMRDYPPFIGDQSAGYLAVNRSKRSFVCDLQTPQGRKLFFCLVKASDVVIEQFRPKVIEKMGLGFRQASQLNEKIIYVSITGYGQDGPYAHKPGHDLNYIGYGGLLHAKGATLPGCQIADVAGGAYMAVIAALCALWQRTQTNRGQHVDVSMLDGVLPLMTLQMAHLWAGAGVHEKTILSGSLACYDVYCCADGKFIALAALEPKFWKNFCQALGKKEWQKIAHEPKLQDKLRQELKVLFAASPRAYWLKLLENEDTCLTPVLEPNELEDNPQLKAREMFLNMPLGGKSWKGLGIPLKFSDSIVRPTLPPPRKGEHTREILQELGHCPREIEELAARKII